MGESFVRLQALIEEAIMDEQKADQIIGDIKTLPLRTAKSKYHIGQEKWQCIEAGRDWWPRNGNGHSEEVVQTILAHVKEKPHLNTAVTAKGLTFQVGRVQAVVKSQGISKLDPAFGGTALCRL